MSRSSIRSPIKFVLKTPFAPLIAQLTDRAGMMVSPKAAKAAGDKFGLHPVCAGPYKFVERVAQDRIVVEKFADYWNKDNVHHRPHRLSADRRRHRASRQPQDRAASTLIERVLATDIKAVRADRKLQLASALEPRLPGHGHQCRQRRRRRRIRSAALGQGAPGARPCAIDREALKQVVFNGEFVPGNQWVSPENPYYQKAFPVPGSATSPRPRRC